MEIFSITLHTLFFFSLFPNAILTQAAIGSADSTENNQSGSNFVAPTNPYNSKCYIDNRKKPAAAKGSTDPKSCLAKHNEYRLKRSLKPLVWDKKLETEAQSWANEKEGVMMHATGTGQGENLYSGEGGCLSAVTMWMAEGPSSLPSYVITENNYQQIGHYSQVMWETTRKLGCGQAHGLVVCRYHPPGNMLGRKMF